MNITLKERVPNVWRLRVEVKTSRGRRFWYETCHGTRLQAEQQAWGAGKKS